MELSPSGPTNDEVTVIVTTDDTGSDIAEAKWASGEQNEAYFADEGEELELEEVWDGCDEWDDCEWGGYKASFTATTNGTYTVYVMDEAGNEKIETIDVANIITDQPAITLSAAPVTTTDGTVTITAAVAAHGVDIGNGVALVKWDKGTRDANYFTASGTDITTGKQFTVTENGDYTVYAKDIAGNSTTKLIHIANITPKASVNFNSNGGSTVNAQTVIINGHATEPTAPARAGYTFGGWYSDSSLTNVFNFAGTAIIYDTTLYAKWTAISTSQPETGSGNVSTGDIKVTATNGQLTLPIGKSGEVSLGTAVTVSIPADASGKELKLTIEKVLDAQKLLTEKDVLASPIYEILKNFSENFSKPVTLTLSFDPASLKNNQRASVYYLTK
ncbi:InlB B-repeat-containing protein [Cohnella silvisoli]|uniref:InlB B-repeat-containing protein n=1 Tax=Cohnella silvisoli TaxID=2873699 RepID=A0ABV1L147_9BACL|nr:InlB B-repeat-containing protein [Cohnella silvisoli]MCD9025288.1 InlB B-repeat-containing protein [Cohnella silvisoli]